jgi:hypothetical protein
MSALYVRLFFVQRRAVSEPETPNIGLGQAIWSATHPSRIQLLGEYLKKASPLDLKFECEVNVSPPDHELYELSAGFALTTIGPI